MAKEKKKRWVNLSALPADRKRAAFEYLKKEQPDTLEIIQSENFQTVLKAFEGSSVIVEIETESK